MSLKTLAELKGKLPASDPMPLLFIGHSSPMHAITDNPYRKAWRQIGERLPPPQAILCISAHWETRGSFVAVTAKPQTIHDFGNFPPELFAQQYPAPGAPDHAQLAISMAGDGG